MTERDELERGVHGFRADVVLRARARAGLVDRLAREHAERDRDRKGRGELGEGSRDRVCENVEMCGLASDQTAERHDRVEPAGARDRRDRRRQLERARDLELLDLRSGGERRADRPLRQSSRDLFVPPCPHDRHAGPAMSISYRWQRLPTRGHIPQSSPPMPPFLMNA